jgi:uncharacterized protein (TIGR00730 family)
MADITSICIFCGARTGDDPKYIALAREVGTALARTGLKLVYGGGRVGLMGAVADAALEAGGHVSGVIPRFLAEKEIEHKGVTEMHVVESMHVRKTLMADLSDGFLALPGGAGTLEEIFEQWTWAQLGIHTKPVGFLNAEGFYDPIVEMMARMKNAGFIQPELCDMVIVDQSITGIIAQFQSYTPPQKKWT